MGIACGWLCIYMDLNGKFTSSMFAYAFAFTYFKRATNEIKCYKLHVYTLQMSRCNLHIGKAPKQWAPMSFENVCILYKRFWFSHCGAP